MKEGSTLPLPGASAIAALALLAACAGCIERQLTVRSDPPGAVLSLDGVEVGETPRTIHFLSYGTRQVTLRKAGYAPVKVTERISAPWYAMFPIDLVADCLAPVRIVDRHELTYKLEPYEPGEDDQTAILQRAQKTRSSQAPASPAAKSP